MGEAYPKNPVHKQIYTSKKGDRYIFSAKENGWYKYDEENKREMAIKEGRGGASTTYFVLFFLFNALVIVLFVISIITRQNLYIPPTVWTGGSVFLGLAALLSDKRW